MLHKAVKAGYNDAAHMAKKLLASLQPKPKGNAPPREPAPSPRAKP